MKHPKAELSSKETTRLEAFSDGVFAIAITLLVLELISTLHSDIGSGLLEKCLHHWQSFVAFTIGFITILVCWINHHVAFDYVKRVDTKLFWINGFLLFVVTLTPFPTAVLAEYLESESKTALFVFGLNYFLISIAASMICSYAYKNNFVEEAHRDFFSSYRKIYFYAIFYNFFALMLSLVSIIIPIILYILLFIAFAAPKEFAMHLQRMKSLRAGKKHKPAKTAD
jgi:uncharacterized membrane protein